MKYDGYQVGIVIKSLRIQRNLTKEALAAELGISVSTIKKYENGERALSITNLFKIIDYFKVDANTILNVAEGKKENSILNGFLMDDSKAVTDFKYKSDLSLAEAKKKYPEWYEKRVVRGEKKGRWHIKRDLYDWWLRKIQSGEVSVGHRYWCLSVLASYGIKCDIPEDEVLTDALELLPMFDNISDDEHNRFTKRDVLDAMNMYQENYVTYSRAEVERVSGISVPPNKRNGRKQDKHLQLARGIRELKSSMGEAVSGGGRPEKSKIVEEWRKSHPDGKKADCIRETGLSKPTVYKWWK